MKALKSMATLLACVSIIFAAATVSPAQPVTSQPLPGASSDAIAKERQRRDAEYDQYLRAAWGGTLPSAKTPAKAPLRPVRSAITPAQNPANFGAVPNDGKDDRAAIQAAINAGDVAFPAGRFDVSGQITVPANRTITGAPGLATKLVFATATNQYAVTLPSATNITISGLDFEANCGVIVSPGAAANVKVIGNAFKWGDNGTYYNRLAVRVLGGSSNVHIDNNYFHDSPNSDRNIDLFNTDSSSYSNNTFHIVHDGGHIDGKHMHLRVTGNHGDRIGRMGIELQDHNTGPGTGGDDVLVADNVFWEFDKPECWTFGLSVPPTYHTNVVIRDNYLSVFAPGATSPTGGYGNCGRPGEGIEVDFTSGSVSGNTIVGPWVGGIVSAVGGSVGGAPLSNNKAYGSMQWGAFTTEGGNRGPGVVKDMGGNTGNLPLASAPTPQQFIDSHGGGGGTTQPSNPTPSLLVSNVTDRECSIAFKDLPVGAATKLQVRFSIPNGVVLSSDPAKPAIDITSGTTAVITDLPTSWDLIATPVVNGVDGVAARFTTSGSPATTYTSPYAGPFPKLKGATAPLAISGVADSVSGDGSTVTVTWVATGGAPGETVTIRCVDVNGVKLLDDKVVTASDQKFVDNRFTAQQTGARILVAHKVAGLTSANVQLGVAGAAGFPGEHVTTTTVEEHDIDSQGRVGNQTVRSSSTTRPLGP
jgi:hypothetical protein